MSDAPQDDLDDLLRRVDPDRWLSSRFVADAGRRADVVAIYAYDHELARAPRVASNSLLGEIRLTWWREVLDEIYEHRHVRHHPTAQALAGAVRDCAIAREPLERMIDARYRELDPEPLSAEEALAWARDTGGAAAEAACAVLDRASDVAAANPAGAAWCLARQVPERPQLASAFRSLLGEGRAAARRLGVPAFPAIAHAALAPRRAAGQQASASDRLRLTLAVARGRI